MHHELPGGLTPEILEKVVIRRLEDKHGIGTATPFDIESLHPFRATIEVIDRNGIWVHVYLVKQEKERFFLEFQETKEEVKKPPQKDGTNLGELLRKALGDRK